MKIRIFILRILIKVIFGKKSILLLKNGKIDGKEIICDEILLIDEHYINNIYAPKSTIINLNKEKTEMINCEILSQL